MAEPSSTAPGTSSTPPAGSPPAAVTEATTAPPTQAAPAAPDASKPVEAAQAAAPTPADVGAKDGTPKPPESPPAEPLFKLPDDFKPPAEALSKFETAIKGAMVDGKLNVTAQQIADWYVDQARDANTAWHKQIQDLNATNEASCKSRFSAQELAASETAVGWFSSVDPAFRDLAKRQLNDPVFVNAMRVVGEMLSEDSFEPAGQPAPNNRPRTRAERAALLYPKTN